MTVTFTGKVTSVSGKPLDSIPVLLNIANKDVGAPIMRDVPVAADGTFSWAEPISPGNYMAVVSRGEDTNNFSGKSPIVDFTVASAKSNVTITLSVIV